MPSVTGSLLAVYRLESSLHFQLPLGRKGIWALRAAFRSIFFAYWLDILGGLSSGLVESLCYVRAVVRDILYLATFRTLSLRDLLSGIYASVVADELWLESNGRIVNALGSAYASWTAS